VCVGVWARSSRPHAGAPRRDRLLKPLPSYGDNAELRELAAMITRCARYGRRRWHTRRGVARPLNQFPLLFGGAATFINRTRT
jgi:hypothetical protein